MDIWLLKQATVEDLSDVSVRHLSSFPELLKLLGNVVTLRVSL